ncbi:MAG: hypothetical protein WAL29_09480 [Bacteroidales bacterium]
MKILIIFFLLISGTKGISQTIPKADSLRIREKGVQTSTAARDQNANGLDNRDQARKKEVAASVKRIKGGRPDWSRARGARPPSVVRPSGSGIPKGVGKPGGAGRKVGR